MSHFYEALRVGWICSTANFYQRGNVRCRRRGVARFHDRCSVYDHHQHLSVLHHLRLKIGPGAAIVNVARNCPRQETCGSSPATPRRSRRNLTVGFRVNC